MPDILSDAPSVFAPGLPDLDAAQTADFAHHNEARDALRAVNEYLHGDRCALGLRIRSIEEFGAVADNGATDNRAAIQACLDSLGSAGGVVFVPPRALAYAWNGTISVPHDVFLVGAGAASQLHPTPPPVQVVDGQLVQAPAIAFTPHTAFHRGGVMRLVLGDFQTRADGIAIDLTNTQRVYLRDLQIWNFRTGVRLSDGDMGYSAHNSLVDFEINDCDTGVVSRTNTHQCTVQRGRINRARSASNEGIGIDIEGGDVVTFSDITVEDFDLGVRVRGLCLVSLDRVYYEADTNETIVPGVLMDIDPAPGSIVRMENSRLAATTTQGVQGSLEDAIVSDAAVTHMHVGAMRHSATAAARNFVPNGTFRRADAAAFPIAIAGWSTNWAPDVDEELADWVTGGRSINLRQSSNLNDALSTSIVVPEAVDYVTLLVRYKNLGSTGIQFFVTSGVGTNSANFRDGRGVTDSQWRIAALVHELDPTANGVVNVAIAPDLDARGGSVRVDEVWAVAGRTAAAPRAHGNRVEFLPETVELLQQTMTDGDPPITVDLGTLDGLGAAPRGAIGAVLTMRAESPRNQPSTTSRPMEATLLGSGGQRWTIPMTVRGIPYEQQVFVRSMSVDYAIDFHGADFDVDATLILDGWILSS